MDGTWEQNHKNQLSMWQVYRTIYNCQKIVFYNSLKFTGLESCMYYESSAVFVKHNGRWNAA